MIGFDDGASGGGGGSKHHTFLKRGSKCKSSLLPSIEAPSEKRSQRNGLSGLNSGMTFGKKKNADGPQPRRVRDPAKRQSKYATHNKPPGGASQFNIFGGDDEGLEGGMATTQLAGHSDTPAAAGLP